jgi:hypothetical protein
MAVGVLRLPDVKIKSETRPKLYLCCYRETFLHLGKVGRPVGDNHQCWAQVHRSCCCSCRCNFRHYPLEVDRADQTQRLRKFVALLWVLGMSLRGTTMVLAAFVVQFSHMTV